MLKCWSFPAWSGDFRLEADGDDKCVLTVVSPTPAELEKLGDFLKRARKKEWVEQHIGFVPDGESRIEVAASIQDCGRFLLGKKPKGRLTAVKSTSGHVSAVTEDPEKAVSAPDAAAAATVQRPTLCCPSPVPGPDERASEVLRTFCTRRQWSEWERDGTLHCYGNLSGRRYEILHRHHPVAVKRGKIVWDMEDRKVMHAYDWSVPPAEEVLELKLVLEHAEHWIRNPSGAYNHDEDIYVNPFVSEADQARDGIWDSMVVAGIGGGVVGAGASGVLSR